MLSSDGFLLYRFNRCLDKNQSLSAPNDVRLIQISNPCPSTSDEEIAESEDSEENQADIKPKKSKGRKSLSTINNLARKRIN